MNKDGNTALHLASQRGHKEIVQLLIEKGIDINQTIRNENNALPLTHIEVQISIKRAFRKRPQTKLAYSYITVYKGS